jgi:hypothetical protein
MTLLDRGLNLSYFVAMSCVAEHLLGPPRSY